MALDTTPIPSILQAEATPHPPALLRRVLASTMRIATSCLLAVAFAGATLAFLKGYVHARRQVTPIIVTPDVSFEQLSHPPLKAILARMVEVALFQMGWAKETRGKLVALTFDDGPYPRLTPQLLAVLKRQNVPATFFIVGRDAQMHPELLRRIVDDGHELGNHSFTHASFITLDERRLAAELQQADQLMRDLTGVATPLMRPPGGRLDASRYQLVRHLGYTVVNDNNNPGDYRESNPLRLYDFTLNHSSRATIVCLHSGALSTIRALPAIIEAYRRKGCRFVSVSQMAQAEGVVIPPLESAPIPAPRSPPLRRVTLP